MRFRQRWWSSRFFWFGFFGYVFVLILWLSSPKMALDLGLRHSHGGIYLSWGYWGQLTLTLNRDNPEISQEDPNFKSGLIWDYRADLKAERSLVFPKALTFIKNESDSRGFSYIGGVALWFLFCFYTVFWLFTLFLWLERKEKKWIEALRLSDSQDQS